MNRPQTDWLAEDFVHPGRATQDTDYVIDPADPLPAKTGAIRRGETVWFAEAPFGSGPTWQPARLMNGTLCYVRPLHFANHAPQPDGSTRS